MATGAAALAAAALAPSSRLFAQPAAHRIDVHHHFSPPAWLSALKLAKLDNRPVNDWTPARSLDDMDKAGIATSMTSATIPALGFMSDAKAAGAVARASNEYARKLADEHKGRFGVFALLPMPHVDETLKEIEYAFDTLKADGVGFMTSYGVKYLGSKEFAPVMDELHRRKATAYTHPNNPACCVNLDTGVPPVIVEYGTDTSRTIASLIFSGTTRRTPDINWIFSHGGGTLPSLTERFATQITMMPKYKQWTFDSVMAELRRCYYDTAQVANPIAMAGLTKLVPVEQILFGTDYPYRTGADHVRGLGEIFSAGDLKKIDRDNALRILPQWRS